MGEGMQCTLHSPQDGGASSVKRPPELNKKILHGTSANVAAFITALIMSGIEMAQKSHFHGSCAKPQLGEELAHVLHLLSSSSVVKVHL